MIPRRCRRFARVLTPLGWQTMAMLAAAAAILIGATL